MTFGFGNARTIRACLVANVTLQHYTAEKRTLQSRDVNEVQPQVPGFATSGSLWTNTTACSEAGCTAEPRGARQLAAASRRQTA